MIIRPLTTEYRYQRTETIMQTINRMLEMIMTRATSDLASDLSDDNKLNIRHDGHS